MSTTSRKPLIERSPAHAAAAAATAAAATAANGTTPRKPLPGCRYIASRTSMNYEVANYVLLNSNVKENVQDGFAVSSNEEYRSYLNSNLLNNSNRILAFKNKPPPPPEGFESNARLMYSETSNSQVNGLKRKAPSRHIPQNAERTLDAPELLDDYYLNLLDWGAKNVLAVALGNTVYLWNASSGSIQELMQAEGPITSVGWAPDGKHIGVGLDNGDVQLWDSFALCKVRTMRGHSARVGSLAWNGGPVLSSGSRDNNIFNHDVRIRDHLITKMTSHQQEVCGLKWSLSGQQLASGGNDNLLHIWDASMMAAGSNAPAPFLHQFNEHQAAVKALAWCPFQSNLLASGGGTSDRCIKFWNTQTGTCLNSVDTNSQVCALQWSKHEKELLSSHGFSQNQLCLWKYPSMTKMAELRGHTSRVLHMAQSPDGFTVASAAADETLRFWQVFGSADNSFKQQQPSRPRKMVYSAATMIR